MLAPFCVILDVFAIGNFPIVLRLMNNVCVSFVFVYMLVFIHACVCVCLQYQSMRLSDVHRKAQLWRGIVSISLIEGHGLQPMDANGLSDPYVKFRMGHQKYKSKVNNLSFPPL